MSSPSRDDIAKAVLAFVNAPTWTESKQIVEAHHDVLLTDDAYDLLADLLAKYRDNEDVTRQLEERRTLLTRCRREGIDAAFADPSNPPEASHEGELNDLLEELSRLTEPGDMPRAVAVARAALTRVDREKEPKLWAILQSQLGNSLSRSPPEDGEKNLEKAIYHYERALEVFARQDSPEWWATTRNDLAAVYRKRTWPGREENFEKAIQHYKRALEVFTRKVFPKRWAMTQNNLASVYADRIRGRAKNIEEAIYHYELVLKVYMRREFPEEWAATQNNLGKVYQKRLYGDPAENIEEAIRRYERALEVYKRQDFPEQWATTQHNLASAYRDRIQGKRAENLEQAIYHCRQALEVRRRSTLSEEWAATQNHLANAYGDRIHGDRAENLEEAIHHYERALEVFTPRDFPNQWAATQNNLGIGYRERIRGDPAENIEEAIRHCRQALKVRTRSVAPEEWATTQNNLGNAYQMRLRGNPEENIEKAIRHYERALEVYKRRGFSERWAAMQINLASAYSDRIREDRAENLKEAIEHYRRALEVYKRRVFPERWASIQHNLGEAYSEHATEENKKKAIHHYRLALEVRTAESFPQYCRDTSYALANLLYDERRFVEARKAFATAREAVEVLRGEIRREGAIRDLAEQNALLYARLVHCCLLENDEKYAFEYAAIAKGRAFVDLLATARFDLRAAETDQRVLAADPARANDLRQTRLLRQQIGNLLAQLTNFSGFFTSTSGGNDLLKKMRADLHALQDQHAALWEGMTYKYPDLTATQQAPALSEREARALAADLGATLVEYYRHAGGWCAFVVAPDTVRHVPLPGIDDDLLKRMSDWLKWLESDQGLGPLSYRPLRRLHEALIEPLRPYLPPGGVVVLAPFGELHLLPLSAALDPASGFYAVQAYRLGFAPSLAALRVALEQVRRKDHPVDKPFAGRLLNVAYPGAPGTDHYLPNALSEAETVARHFAEATPLYQDAATPDAVLANARDQDVIHLCCHGSFNTKTPEQSGLMLSGGHLTVQRIIIELRLEQTLLVTLSACESGQLEVRRGEEHVGLLQAMMSTGAQAVIASLWEVNDAATRDLFEAFYTRVAAGNSPADALAEAAREVRSSPDREHPYYWSAFQVSGLAHGANGTY